MTHFFDIGFVLLQRLLPRRLLTAAVYRLARVRRRAVKDFLIQCFLRLYDVDPATIDGRAPEDFDTFNAFFTRALRDGARPIDASPDSVVAPVDGSVSAVGPIEDGRLYQAKGISYALHELLAVDIDEADRYVGGSFATIYLAPYNYHRVHVPLDGRLRAIHHVPGELYSVNAATVRRMPGLFAVNERLILHFDARQGPFVVVMVGALNVGSMTTPWTGECRARGGSGVVDLSSSTDTETERTLTKGDLLGWFNLGSTVIVLFPAGVLDWSDALAAGRPVTMGERIGTLSASSQ